METVVTKLRPNIQDDSAVVIVLGRPEAQVGHKIELKFNSRNLGEYYISEIDRIMLMDLTQEDLDRLAPGYQNKGVLWSKLETIYSSGLPGEFEVTIITCTKEFEGEQQTQEDILDEPSYTEILFASETARRRFFDSDITVEDLLRVTPTGFRGKFKSSDVRRAIEEAV